MIIFMMIMVIVMQIITSIIKGIPTDIKYRNFIHATYAFLVAALLFLSCGKQFSCESYLLIVYERLFVLWVSVVSLCSG